MTRKKPQKLSSGTGVKPTKPKHPKQPFGTAPLDRLTPNAAKLSDNSRGPLKSLDDSHSYTLCTDSTHTTSIGSTSQTETGTVNAATQPLPTQMQCKNTFSTSAPFLQMNEGNSSPPVSRLHETLMLLGSDMGLLTTVNFLKASGALTSNSRPYHPPKMPTIPSEVDIADISDEEPD